MNHKSPTSFLRVLLPAVLAALILYASPAGVRAQEEQEEEEDAEPEHFFQGWTGRIDFGYTYQSGRTDRNEFTLRGQADREVGIHSYRAIAEYIYGEQNGVKSSDRYGASFRWRRDLSEYFYTQTLTSYEVDRIRRIEHRAEQNATLGYQFLDRDNLDASIGPGVTAQYNQEIGVDTGMNYYGTLFQDVNWQMTEAYRFEEDSTFLVNLEDEEDYIYRFNAGVVGTVTESVNLSIRYNFLYENQVAPDVDRAEHRLVTSIGYAF